MTTPLCSNGWIRSLIPILIASFTLPAQRAFPRAWRLNHRSTIDFADWAFDRLGLDGSEVMGSLAPIYFDAYTSGILHDDGQGRHLGCRS